MMMVFEDNCIIENTMDSAKLRTFRGHSRGYLGKILENYQAVKTQQADSLGLAILLMAAIKIGMGKKAFVKCVKDIARRKNISVSAIRKTKCYSLVKKLVIASH